MIIPAQLRMIAWEITRRCNLACIHCRGSSLNEDYEGELSTDEARSLVDHISDHFSPTIILTGGEPLMRSDVFDLARYIVGRGLRAVLATNGTLVSPDIAKDIKNSGISRVSVSIDGSTEEEHDSFRGVKGAFKGALLGIEALKAAGVPFQINVTVTKRNVGSLEGIFSLSKELGAAALHTFLLVPTGRGEGLLRDELTPEEYEDVLNWFYDKRVKDRSMEFKATCAPHYYRIIRQRAKKDGIPFTKENFGVDYITRGCLGGISFCFISYCGVVQPCGYLEIPCGDIRKTPFKEIWERSQVFLSLRDQSNCKGKCGVCEFFRVCGGCRARAYTVNGDYLGEEPFCSYIPRGGRDGSFSS